MTIGGMAKGSGMIHPNMCTMLAFITTDAVIAKETLQKALSGDVDDTYNMISVDGDTSTNDTVILLANGLAGNPEIAYGSPGVRGIRACPSYHQRVSGQEDRWGRRRSHGSVRSKGHRMRERGAGQTLAKSIVCSNLTKTAIAGHDANWGRILCAMGYSGAQFDPEKVDLFFESAAGKLQIIENGVALNYSEEKQRKFYLSLR